MIKLIHTKRCRHPVTTGDCFYIPPELHKAWRMRAFCIANGEGMPGWGHNYFIVGSNTRNGCMIEKHWLTSGYSFGYLGRLHLGEPINWIDYQQFTVDPKVIAITKALKFMCCAELITKI